MWDEPVTFVVEDDEAFRDSLKALLESAGLTVETYASGEEFLQAYDSDRCGLTQVGDLSEISGHEGEESARRR